MQTSGQFGVPQGEVPQFLGRVQTHHLFNLSTATEMGTLSSSSATSHPHHLQPQQQQQQAVIHQPHTQQQAAHQAQTANQHQPSSAQQQQEQLTHPHHHSHHLTLLPQAHQQQSHRQNQSQQTPAHQLQQPHHQIHQLFQQAPNGFAAPITAKLAADGQGTHPSSHHAAAPTAPSIHLQHLHQSMLHSNSSPQSSPSPTAPYAKSTNTATTAAAASTLASAPANLNTAHNLPTTKPGLNSPNPPFNPNANPDANPSSGFPQSSAVNTGAMGREESYDGDEQDMEEGDQRGGGAAGGGGSRWPRQEALALLKVRSEMDAVFRDSSLKGPLWDEVSRKLAAMGYHRSAKKCKEKFENVHKYYKRTKDGKAGRQDGKSYRFFSQLEALYGKTVIGEHAGLSNSKDKESQGTSIQQDPSTIHFYDMNATNSGFDTGLAPAVAAGPPAQMVPASAIEPHKGVGSPKSHDSERSTSGLNLSTDSLDDDDDDDDDDGNRGSGSDDGGGGVDGGTDGAAKEQGLLFESRKRKRKLSPVSKKYLAFFENAMRKVLQKQEQMQQKFLEALERRDNDRRIREEAWKRQEMARLSREHDLRNQERALAASRDATLVAFLEKITGQPFQLPQVAAFHAPAQPPSSIPPLETKEDYQHIDRELYDPNSKRWPKPEVLTLIKLRTMLDQKFHEPGSKSQLWEEISAAMASQGFSRSAKRCKEKWENINKYFKKAKESNKKRPENAKTCPYYHHLDALYKEGVLGGSHSKQLLLERGEQNSGNLNVSAPSTQPDGDSALVPEVSSQALAVMPAGDNQAAGLLKNNSLINSTSNESGLPFLMGSDANAGSVKKAVKSKPVENQQQTIDSGSMSPPNASSSLPQTLERMNSSKSTVSGSSKPDQAQLKDVQFGSIM